MSEAEKWCYVAVDPAQPGTAWAITMDDGRYVAGMYADLARWARKGAVPTRMKLSEGVEMVKAWQRPQKKNTGAKSCKKT